MSKETWHAIEDALKAHIADEHEGAYLTQWVLVAHSVDPSQDGAFYYTHMAHDGPVHEKIGLLEIALTARRSRFVNDLYRPKKDE